MHPWTHIKQILCTDPFEGISLFLPGHKILYQAIYAEVENIDATSMGYNYE